MDWKNMTARELDYQMRIHNWSVKIHNGQIRGFGTNDYLVAR